MLKPGAEADADNVVAFCKEHLAAYKVPRAVQFVEALPCSLYFVVVVRSTL